MTDMLLSQSWFFVITKTQRGILFTRSKRGDLRGISNYKNKVCYMHKYGEKYTKRVKWCDDNPDSGAIIKSKVEVSDKEICKEIIVLQKRP